MQICNFFADSKSRAQELSNDVSFVIFGHQTWDLEGGDQIDLPPSISWFSSTPAEIGLKQKIHDALCAKRKKNMRISLFQWWMYVLYTQILNNQNFFQKFYFQRAKNIPVDHVSYQKECFYIN